MHAELDEVQAEGAPLALAGAHIERLESAVRRFRHAAAVVGDFEEHPVGARRGGAQHEAAARAHRLAGYAFDSWIGLLGPAAVPRDTVRVLNATMAKLLQDPTILERLDKQGVVPQAMTPEAFGELLRADYAKMARVVKISGARID